MSVKIIHHVNPDFTFEVVETQILLKGKVISSFMSSVQIIK